jgi:hypothetical protein
MDVSGWLISWATDAANSVVAFVRATQTKSIPARFRSRFNSPFSDHITPMLDHNSLAVQLGHPPRDDVRCSEMKGMEPWTKCRFWQKFLGYACGQSCSNERVLPVIAFTVGMPFRCAQTEAWVIRSCPGRTSPARGGPAEPSTDFPLSLHFDVTICDITGTKNGPADASKKLLRISPDARAGSEGMLVRGLMDRVDVEPTEFSQRGCTHSAA